MNDRTQQPPAPQPTIGQVVHHGYVDRYCAFIDILGFRGLIGSLKDKDDRLFTLRKALRKLQTPIGQPTGGYFKDFRAQSISDAVVISVVSEPVTLFQVIEDLAVDLLKEGYFIRGALVKGKLYHDDTIVFGEALLRAYDLESTVVHYPRVMITRDVMAEINEACNGPFFGDQAREMYMPHIVQAEDGPHFVHVLKTVAANVQKHEHLNEYQLMQDMIQKKLDEATDNPGHYKKVQWFALYWRKFVPCNLTGFEAITGPGI